MTLTYAVSALHELSMNLDDVGSDLFDVDAKDVASMETLGHAKVVGAFENFRTNWDDHRELLSERLKRLGDLAQKAADGYSSNDADLAKKIQQAIEGGK